MQFESDSAPHRSRDLATGRGWLALSLALCLALLLGCEGTPVDPDQVTGRIVAAGEFVIREGVPTLVTSNSRIDCEVGRIFGVDYEVEVPEGSAGPIPIVLRWVHPAIEALHLGVSGTETSGGASNPILPRGATVIGGRSLWNIAHPGELVPGRYAFEIRTMNDTRTILSHAFEIEGCKV